MIKSYQDEEALHNAKTSDVHEYLAFVCVLDGPIYHNTVGHKLEQQHNDIEGLELEHECEPACELMQFSRSLIN